MEQILKTLGSSFLSLKDFGFAYGVQGILLRQNLEKFWLLECITMSKYNVFLTPSNALISNMKNLNDEVGFDNLPFGIAEIDNVKNTWNKSLLPSHTNKLIQHKIAKVSTIYESDGAITSVKDLFYTKQRERKSWWRKISQNPSIYYMTEVKKERGKEYAEIEARFSFGKFVVETIYFKNNASKLLPHNQNDNLRVVEHITSLDWGCLALLLDGYTEIEGSKELHVYPKLSPYKAYCKAIISPEDDDVTKEDLNDLTLYIIQLLRRNGVESIYMNNVKNPEIFRVPYIITVSSDTLKTGLLKVVSQRTLCGETVHITDVAKRMYELAV